MSACIGVNQIWLPGGQKGSRLTQIEDEKQNPENRKRGLQTLAKEGWLWMKGMGRKWVMLRKNKGLLWSQAPKEGILGMVLFPFLTSFNKARDDDCVIEFTRNRAGVVGAKVQLRAETADEADNWYLHISAEFESFKANNGIGYLEEVQVLQPAQEFVIKLPAVDLDTEVRKRAVVFHVVEGQDFEEGDLLCEIERAKGITPVVQVFASFQGKVMQISKSRKEKSKDERMAKYSYFAVDDPILRLLREPDWLNGERFLPRIEPTAMQRECRAKKLDGLELVDHDEANPIRFSSRTASRATIRLPSRACKSQSAGKIDVTTLGPILAAAAYTDHADEFWTKNALILDSLHDNLLANTHTTSAASFSRASSRGQLRHSANPDNGAPTSAVRRPNCGTGISSGSQSFGGGGLRRVGTDRNYTSHCEYSLQTLENRYSSMALAAASKILLGM